MRRRGMRSRRGFEMTLLQRILHWRRTYLPTLRESTEDMCREFEETFPKRCLICSYHAYGRREGHTTDLMPAHECCES